MVIKDTLFWCRFECKVLIWIIWACKFKKPIQRNWSGLQQDEPGGIKLNLSKDYGIVASKSQLTQAILFTAIHVLGAVMVGPEVNGIKYVICVLISSQFRTEIYPKSVWLGRELLLWIWEKLRWKMNVICNSPVVAHAMHNLASP